MREGRDVTRGIRPMIATPLPTCIVLGGHNCAAAGCLFCPLPFCLLLLIGQCGGLSDDRGREVLSEYLFFCLFVRVAGNGEIRLRPFPGDNPFIAAQSSYATSFEP